MRITKATFVTSVAKSDGILNDNIPEFAFVGRSNVGKSSLINSLTNQKKLVKTSSTPGHTKLINYFNINDGEFRLVDLPGYGYAKASGSTKENWSTLMADYLVSSKDLKLVFVLVDVRIAPSALDKQMINYLFYNHKSLKVIVTKCDKVPKSKLKNYVDNIAKALSLGTENVLAYSSETAFGKEKVLETMENYINQNME